MICQFCLRIRANIPLEKPALRCPRCLVSHSFDDRYQKNTVDLIENVSRIHAEQRDKRIAQTIAKREATRQANIAAHKAAQLAEMRQRLAPFIDAKRIALSAAIADLRERGLLPQRVRTRRWRLRNKRRAKRLA